MKTKISILILLILACVQLAPGQPDAYQVTLRDGAQIELPSLVTVGDSIVLRNPPARRPAFHIDSIANIKIKRPSYSLRFAEIGGAAGGILAITMLLSAKTDIDKGFLYFLLPATFAGAGYLLGGFIGLIYGMAVGDNIIDLAEKDPASRRIILKELIRDQQVHE